MEILEDNPLPWIERRISELRDRDAHLEQTIRGVQEKVAQNRRLQKSLEATREMYLADLNAEKPDGS